MNISNNEKQKLPHHRYFQLCSNCGICNKYCTVNTDRREGKGSTTTPQEIASHLLNLESNLHEGSTVSDKIDDDRSITPTFICTACALCEHSCPYMVPFLDNLIEARNWIRNTEAEAVPPAILDMETELFKKGNPFGHPRETRDEWIKDDFPELETAEVVYYPGCQTAYSLFSIEKSIMKVIRAAGVSVTYPGPQDKCCGRPVYFSGRLNDIEKVARSNVDLVTNKSAKALVANCSSCYLAYKKDYPPIVGKLPFDVYHTTEYFNLLVKEGRLKFKKPLDKKIIYHDPCELTRVGGVVEPPRELLNAIPGANILEFSRNRLDGLCCGGGGLFESVDEKQAYALGERIVLEAIDSGADILATACPTCNSVFNMAKDNLIKNKSLTRKIKINDISEILSKIV